MTRRDHLNPRINRRVDEVPNSGSARQIIPERCTTAPAIDLRGNLSHGFETVSASSARQSSEGKYGGYWIALSLPRSLLERWRTTWPQGRRRAASPEASSPPTGR